MRPCLLQQDFVILFPPLLQSIRRFTCILASSDSETYRNRNHYTFKVHSLPCPRCIVTISSGGDFMANQRPCVEHPHACSLDPGGGLFHATFENASGQYPVSNTSIDPHHLLSDHPDIRKTSIHLTLLRCTLIRIKIIKRLSSLKSTSKFKGKVILQ